MRQYSLSMAFYALGFTSVEQEQPDVAAEIEGAIPDWLQGTLLRNGPALWQAGKTALRHWFDGFAMLHSFGIRAGGVRYRNRFLDTPDLRAARSQGRLLHPQFATDPCRGLFKKVSSMFVSDLGANPNVNVVQLGKRFIALTETPMAIEFDPQTLETLGLFDYDGDGMSGQITSAHPIWNEQTLYNFTVKMGRESRYRGYRLRAGGQRQEFAHHAASQPAYLHSCALTQRELILWEGPLLVKPLELLWRQRPYIECYRWRPERGSRLVLLGREGGSRSLELPSLFVFHHVNSFYVGETLCVDVLAYPDASVIEHLYLDRLLAETGPAVPAPRLTRIRVEKSRTEIEVLSQEALELPRLLEAQGSPYRYVYGIGRVQGRFYDALVRLDSQGGPPLHWHQPGCYPGEPVPVQSPDGTQPVLLSAVLDTAHGQSFLLVLDAHTFQERARAYIPAVVPFGFHGSFTAAQ